MKMDFAEIDYWKTPILEDTVIFKAHAVIKQI